MDKNNNETVKEEIKQPDTKAEVKADVKKTEVITTPEAVKDTAAEAAEKAPKVETKEVKPAEKKTVTKKAVKSDKKKSAPEKKTTAAKKPVAKKNTSTKKPATSKAAPKEESVVSTVIQYNNKDFNVDDIIASVKKDYSDKYSEDVKNLAVYVKPEDGKAYYVVNDSITDSIDI